MSTEVNATGKSLTEAKNKALVREAFDVLFTGATMRWLKPIGRRSTSSTARTSRQVGTGCSIW